MKPVVLRLLTRRLLLLPHRRHLSSSAAAEQLEPFDQRKLPSDYDPSTFNPDSSRPPPADRVWRLVDDVSGLTLVELADLSSILAQRLGMRELPALGIAGSFATSGSINQGGEKQADEKKAEEKTVFDLRLDSYESASKIKVIKEVRGFTDLGLKEAKELVEKTPAVIKRGVSKEDAQQIIEKLKAVGAKVMME